LVVLSFVTVTFVVVPRTMDDDGHPTSAWGRRCSGMLGQQNGDGFDSVPPSRSEDQRWATSVSDVRCQSSDEPAGQLAKIAQVSQASFGTAAA
jgi:hypothetical protein